MVVWRSRRCLKKEGWKVKTQEAESQSALPCFEGGVCVCAFGHAIDVVWGSELLRPRGGQLSFHALVKEGKVGE